MSAPLLSARLQAGYGKTTLLSQVEFELWPGECVGLAGSSGAGKSTLVLALLGLLPWRRGWATGEVMLNGRNLLRLPEREARSLRGREIALVPQSPLSALNPALTLRAHFEEAWRAHERRREGLEGRIRELLAAVHLPGDPAFLNRRPSQISVGQAQRVVIAIALLHRPSILIADEPTSSLDPVTAAQIVDLLREVQCREAASLLYISHDLTSLLKLCSRLAVLDAGELSALIPIERLDCETMPSALVPLLKALPLPLAVMLRHLRGKVTTQEGTERTPSLHTPCY